MVTSLNRLRFPNTCISGIPTLALSKSGSRSKVIPSSQPVTQAPVYFIVKINGEELNIAGKTVAEYLATTNYDPTRIAVERNGDLVPKAQYGETVLKDGDSVEVVSFVGGG